MQAGRAMKTTRSGVRSLGVFLCLLLLRASSACGQTANFPARITRAIDEKNVVTLRGNVHPLARPELDQGPIADSTPMNRMLLLLQRSLEQEAALQQLMTEQMSKASPNFHKWVTPQRF